VRRAYAYLLIPTHRSLTEQAEKRLKTMLSATELGAGFRIAMKDLEIRGAGNILGAAQSGHIHAVGFDLYTRLLGEAVESIRAQREAGVAGQFTDHDDVALLGDPLGATDAFASVDLGNPANIPESYISDLSLRLGIYRRLAHCATPSDIDSMEEEMLDRFGPRPWQVQNLLYLLRLRLRATHAGVQTITREDDLIVLRLHDDVGDARQPLQKLLGRGVVVGNSQLRLELGSLADGWEGPLKTVVERLAEFRERMAAELGVVI